MNGHLQLDIDIKEFELLEYNRASIDGSFLTEYYDSGHELNRIKIFNYFEPNPMPSVVDKVRDFFDYDKVSIAVNLMEPGDYLPLHSDLYKRWGTVFEVNNVESINRHIVMLDDHQPGQMLVVDNDAYNSWKSGDYFSWIGHTPHAIYNFSKVPRYALQVTGL